MDETEFIKGGNLWRWVIVLVLFFSCLVYFAMTSKYVREMDEAYDNSTGETEEIAQQNGLVSSRYLNAHSGVAK